MPCAFSTNPALVPTVSNDHIVPPPRNHRLIFKPEDTIAEAKAYFANFTARTVGSDKTTEASGEAESTSNVAPTIDVPPGTTPAENPADTNTDSTNEAPNN